MTKHTNTNSKPNPAGWYANAFKGWREGQLGPKPTDALLNTVHMLGLRPGKQALANAMYLRDGGATSSQVVIACGAPQLNRMRGLIDDGLVRRNEVPPAANGHSVYSISLTPKGDKRVATRQAAADKATADQGTAPAPKAKRKAKPAPVPAATGEAPAGEATTPVPVAPVTDQSAATA